MKRLLLLLSLISMRHVNGQGYVTIPDTNFCAYLQSIIPTAMSGNQLDTTNTLVTTTTHSINVVNKSIASLSGIQYFSSLTYLNCQFNQYLTSLPILPNTITYLDCDYCSLTSLPVLPNGLKYLNCSNNHLLASLPALPNSLTYLNCAASWHGNNQYANCGGGWGNPPPYGILNCLPVLPNSLDTLICCYNSISCFPTFPNSLLYVSLDNPFYCLPNYVLPAMNSYTTVPLCTTSNPSGCAISANGNACAVAGISQISGNNIQISVYPNPTSDQFYIETNVNGKLNVDLFDVNGRHVFNANVSDKENINVANLDNGAYTLTIKTADRMTNKKLVILR